MRRLLLAVVLAGACNNLDDPPAGSCNTLTGCTSGSCWSGSGDGSPLMEPGRACISCHAATGGDAPPFTIAGTVYPTAHEPDQCNGAGGAQVVITDANGNVVTLTANGAGNFYYLGAIALPFQARVVDGNGVRAMSVPQSTGDCNSCHTAVGANGAPGRIMAP
jgi:hypothetical protein